MKMIESVYEWLINVKRSYIFDWFTFFGYSCVLINCYCEKIRVFKTGIYGLWIY